MKVSEKVAYLKGLAEGLGIDTETKEGKIISAIIDTLEDIAVELTELDENALAIGDELDAISDDLSDVEEFVFGDDEEDDDEDGCCCCDDDEEEYTYAVECPSCGKEIAIEESDIIMGEINCPFCNEKLELDVDEDDDSEGGCCCCGDNDE